MVTRDAPQSSLGKGWMVKGWAHQKLRKALEVYRLIQEERLVLPKSKIISLF